MIITVRNQQKIFLEISRDDINNWVYAQWIGQVSTEDVKEGSLKILDELKQSKYRCLLNNNKDLVGHWDGANEWIANEWIPKALKAKLEKFAHVLSDYSFGQASAETLHLNVGDRFEMRLFKNIDEAKEWLLKDGC
jgi:hypothetical protein